MQQNSHTPTHTKHRKHKWKTKKKTIKIRIIKTRGKQFETIKNYLYQFIILILWIFLFCLWLFSLIFPYFVDFLLFLKLLPSHWCKLFSSVMYTICFFFGFIVVNFAVGLPLGKSPLYRLLLLLWICLWSVFTPITTADTCQRNACSPYQLRIWDIYDGQFKSLGIEWDLSGHRLLRSNWNKTQ